MTDDSQHPYVTRMDPRFGALELMDVGRLVGECEDEWYNETLCVVNESVIRFGVLRGEYHWHEHAEEDEFFLVLEGRLLIDLDDRTVELGPWQGLMVPRGIRHRTRAPERTVVVMVEPNTIVPTGD